MLRPTRTTMNRLSTIGWIGLGAMGHPMALNLFTKTYLAHQQSSASDHQSGGAATGARVGVGEPRYVICEQDEGRVDSFLTDLRNQGGSELASKVERLSSGKEVAQTASRILTMLPSTPQVESVYLDKHTGISAGLQSLSSSDAPILGTANPVGSSRDEANIEQLSSTTTISPGPDIPGTQTPPIDSSTTLSPSSQAATSSSSQASAPLHSTGNGDIENSTAHTLLIDCTTLSPTSAIQVAEAIHASTNGHAMMLDAPVSGGTVAAAQGQLTIMFGSPSDTVTQMALPLLQTMARDGGVMYCGSNGKGVGVKVCNNLILAINQIALAEGLALGRSLDIDPTLLHNVINTSSGASWSSRVNSPLAEIPGSPGERGYKGGFQSRLMLKDAGLALQAASDLDLPIPMTWAAKSIYEAVCNEEGEDWATRDFSVVYEWIKKKQSQGVERGWKADPTST
ncbi:hypothetical protein I316_04989 [Kwoniella heveanensis BCC8398]|uniref:3-hydroxyisobutyrate dehydrogenase n=1 Tax=Kwoniella heveanensis BCC8398 TaxID=1296120 RepID=A0A1B9GQI0_9TREE|nr:hypothetical protein I316_04989 [Kwoniella heveanensis BCC8398]